MMRRTVDVTTDRTGMDNNFNCARTMRSRTRESSIERVYYKRRIEMHLPDFGAVAKLHEELGRHGCCRSTNRLKGALVESVESTPHQFHHQHSFLYRLDSESEGKQRQRGSSRLCLHSRPDHRRRSVGMAAAQDPQARCEGSLRSETRGRRRGRPREI